MDRTRRNLRLAWLSMALIAGVAIAFGPAVANGFVNLDDQANLISNQALRGPGLAPYRWAWTTRLLGVYQPIGWMLLAAESAAFGLDPRGYHLVSVAWHAVNAVGLFFVSRRLLLMRSQGDVDPSRIDLGSALAAGIWAAHPMRVEAVAWASCQPYLPAATFAILAILAYGEAHPVGRPRRKAMLMLSYALAISAALCKGAALGVAGVFLVMDLYPGNRFDGWFGPQARRAWLEKLPILVLGVALATIGARSKGLASVEIADRGRPIEAVARAGFAAVFYPAKTLWPVDLCVHYGVSDRPGASIAGFVAGSLLMIGLGLVIAARHGKWPGFSASSLAYLALLAPSLGLSGFGHVIAADRYGYLPLMAFTPMLASGLTGRRIWLGLAIALGLAGLTRSQCRTWLDGESLWSHALAIDGGKSPQPIDGLAEATLELGEFDRAISLYETALHDRPSDPFARTGLGLALFRRGDRVLAIGHLSIAARLRPGDFPTRSALGDALLQGGRVEESLIQLSAASSLRPVDVDVLVQLGIAYATLGRFDEARARFSEALRLDPHHPGAIGGLARIERKKRKRLENGESIRR